MYEYEFAVAERPLIINVDGKNIEDKTRKVILREDDSSILGVVGSGYQVVTHPSVIDGVESVFDESGEDWKFSRTVHVSEDGGAFMRASYRFPQMKFGVVPAKGDYVSFGLDIMNSYSGRSAVKMVIKLIRLVCTNGMTVADRTFNVASRHLPSFDIEVFKRQIVLAREHLEKRALPLYAAMHDTVVTEERSAAIFDELSGAHYTKIPAKYGEAAKAELKKESVLTLWALYNAFTWVISHEFDTAKVERQNILLATVDKYFSRQVTGG